MIEIVGRTEGGARRGWLRRGTVRNGLDSGLFVFVVGGLVMTRKEVARMVGIAEATLRGAEDNGILPPFDPDRAREYMLAIEVWRAARAGGASSQRYGAAVRDIRAEGAMRA